MNIPRCFAFGELTEVSCWTQDRVPVATNVVIAVIVGVVVIRFSKY